MEILRKILIGVSAVVGSAVIGVVGLVLLLGLLSAVFFFVGKFIIGLIVVGLAIFIFIEDLLEASVYLINII